MTTFLFKVALIMLAYNLAILILIAYRDRHLLLVLNVNECLTHYLRSVVTIIPRIIVFSHVACVKPFIPFNEFSNAIRGLPIDTGCIVFCHQFAIGHLKGLQLLLMVIVVL